MPTGRPAPGSDPALIGGRYRVENMLGQGGTAAVYAAFDTVGERVVALKRLLPARAQEAHVARRFEREYHTLSQLVHPCIVAVYDYHSDDVAPFYTMELLRGGDLRQSAPVAWREACRVLCDVCSALALLHGRRLVHRDLTPLNIRYTRDDRAKLFDFGAMVQFGRSKHLVGTPPFVPPEALHGQPLDGQSDLFALGATAYFALTGRHAYPARSLADLSAAWATTPEPPSRLVPEIPPALDEFVMALLSQSRSARPLSAAEVMERLSAIAGFAIDEALIVSAAYLSTPTLVGRDDKLRTFERKLKGSFARQGAALLIGGDAGAGRSRFLDACALEAKLSGALVVRADASDAGGEGWGVAAAICEQLLAELPEVTATFLAPHLGLISPLLPELATRLNTSLESLPPHAATEAGATAPRARGELQQVLRDLCLEVAQHRTLVVLADDLERIDEPSAALLALLSHEAPNHNLLVAASLSRDGATREPRALKLFAAEAQAVALQNLNASDTEQLVVSLFGEVPNVHWLADRMFGLTAGNPLLVMRVAQHLVDAGVCRYTAGSWTLPSAIDAATLADALQETLPATLSEAALDFARILALTELPRISLEFAAKLWSHADPKRMHAEALELVAAQIVSIDKASIGFRRPSWKQLLLEALPDSARRELHLRIAASCGSSVSEQFRLVRHLVSAGELDRATALLIQDQLKYRDTHMRDPAAMFDYVQALPADWSQTFHACIATCRASQRSRRDLIALQIGLLGYATLSARSERETILELGARLHRDTGLDLLAEYAGTVPAAELITRALGDAQKRHDASPEAERGYSVVESLALLAQLISFAIGEAGRSQDLALLRAMPSLAPLAVLSPALAVVQQNRECSYDLMCGHSDRALAGYLKLAQRLDEPDHAGLEDSHHIFIRLSILWGIGLIEANLGRPSAWQRADAVAGHPLFAVNALRLRAIAALALGDRGRAEDYRVQMELLQIQNSPPQLFEGAQSMQWVFGYAAIGDLLRVKQYLSELEGLAREHRGYRPTMHAGRGVYQALRGDFVQAQAELEESLTLMDAGTHAAWSFAAGALIWSIARQRNYAAAIARGRALLSDMQAVNMCGNTHAVLVPLAFAEARSGETRIALEHVEAALEILRADGGSGVLLGQAYEVRAYVALHMKDGPAFQKYAALCHAQFRLGNQPSVIARHTKLLAAAREAGLALQSAS